MIEILKNYIVMKQKLIWKKLTNVDFSISADSFKIKHIA